MSRAVHGTISFPASLSLISFLFLIIDNFQSWACIFFCASGFAVSCCFINASCCFINVLCCFINASCCFINPSCCFINASCCFYQCIMLFYKRVMLFYQRIMLFYQCVMLFYQCVMHHFSVFSTFIHASAPFASRVILFKASHKKRWCQKLSALKACFNADRRSQPAPTPSSSQTQPLPTQRLSSTPLMVVKFTLPLPVVILYSLMALKFTPHHPVVILGSNPPSGG